MNFYAMEYNRALIDFATLLVLLSTINTVVLSVERFIEEPSNSTVSQGQNHILRCSVADRQGTVQWLRDKFGLGPGPKFEGYPRYVVNENLDSGEYHLNISDIQLEDDAVFECQVGKTQHSNGLKSRGASLSVLLPADSIQIKEGSPADVIASQINVFTCTALNGRPAPSINWYSPTRVNFLSDREHNITQLIKVQKDGKREDVVSTLSLIPTKADQGAEIVCSARNDAMSTPKISSVLINVLYKPDVTMDAANKIVVVEGSSLVLRCSASGNPNILNWRWLRDGVEISEEIKESLRIPLVSSSLDSCLIECEASNNVGTSRDGRFITVHYGPQFLQEPQFPAASIGDDVTLKCEVGGNPPAAVHWTRSGSSRIIGSGSSLLIQNVREEDFRSGFTCSASGGAGAKVHRQVRILKRGPPRIVSSKDQGASYGSLGKVECVVEGVPKPTKISWSKDGQDIDTGTSKRHRIREEDLTYGVKSVLEILSVQPSDFSTYNCTTISGLGSDWMVISFTKREVIPIAYIITGVVIGVLIILAIIVALVLYHRRKRLLSHSGGSSTASSDDSIKKTGQPNLKIEFSTDTVDAWQQQNLLDLNYPQPLTSEYDELRYGGCQDSNSLQYLNRNGYASSVDGYGTYGYGGVRDPYYRPASRQTLDNPYGTLPRTPGNANANGRLNGYPAARSDVGYYGSASGSDIYATYGGRRPRYGHPWAGTSFLPPTTFDRLPPPPLSPAESKLSTNV